MNVRAGRAGLRFALLVVSGYTLFFTWAFAEPIVRGTLLSESDLYEYFLPVFLAPATTWSSYEFAGLPAYADPGDAVYYPLQSLARLAGSWTALVVSAYVVAAVFAFAYVYSLTRSRLAAAIAGLAFGYGEATIERAAHLGFLHSLAWLPLIALAVDGLRTGREYRWGAIGAVAIACAFLGGHPQSAVYTYYCCGLYAVVGGRAEGAPRRYYANVLAMFVLGGVLAGIKVLPFVEASFQMNRQAVNFGAFASHVNSIPQMLTVLFPTVVHEGRDAPTYVGLVTLVFALLGASLFRQNWRARFWLVAAVLSLMLGVGDATPLTRLAYNVPLFDNFRLIGRQLFVFAFGVAALAGMGLAAVLEGRFSRRRILLAILILAGGLLMGALILVGWPQYFQFEPRPSWPGLSVSRAGIVVQGLLAAGAVAGALTLACSRYKRIAGCALMALLAVDLTYATPYAVSWLGLHFTAIPPALVQPSVHARQLASETAPERQRLLALSGTGLDALVPGAFARVWRIPIAGGYGPLLLRNQGELATMAANGDVHLRLLAPEDSALNVLAVKKLIVRPAVLPRPSTFERAGLVWATTPLGLNVGPSDCGHKYTKQMSVALPAGLEVTSVAVVARMRCAEKIPQGADVGQVRIVAADGEAHQQVLRAGIEISDLFDRNEESEVAHRQTPRFDDLTDEHSGSLVRVELPHAMQVRRVEFESLGTGGWIVVNRVTAVDTAGRAWPQSEPDIYLNDDRRWRESARFMTSRTSDRDRDVDQEGEEEYIVYDNIQALPRAWIVSEVVPLRDYDALLALRHGYLPGGRRFDPHRVALVDADSGMAAVTFPATDPSAHVREMSDGDVLVDTEAGGGGFLVLSDSEYPGWQAWVDGHRVSLVRTDYSLRGVSLTPGRHTVEFRFVSRTFQAGAGLSGLGLASLVVLAGLDWRSRRRDRVSPVRRS